MHWADRRIAPNFFFPMGLIGSWRASGCTSHDPTDLCACRHESPEVFD